MLTNTYRPHVGGVAASVETLVDECRRQGHRVRVVAPGFPGDEHEDEPGVLRVPAIQRFNGSDFSVPVPLPRIVNHELARFRPDVVHTHHPFLLGDAALRWAYAHDRPLVFTHHTLYENYTHYVPLDSPALKHFVIRLATDFANCCDRVIAPSRSVAELIVERGVETPIDVIPTGVATETFADADGAGFRRSRGLPKQATVLGHVGRLAREKNLAFLARAVIPWLTAGAERRFLLVGDGPDSPELRRRFEHAGVAGRVLMTGKLTGSNLCDAYAAMDAFVFASRTETQGMVVAEAMAAGLPVFALDGPGVRDVVGDGDNGRLLPATADPDTFAAALEQGTANERLAEWRSEALRTAERFDRARCAADVMRVYRGLGSRRERRSTDWTWWDRLRGRIEAEWELLSTKADSATGSLSASDRRPGRTSPRGRSGDDVGPGSGDQ